MLKSFRFWFWAAVVFQLLTAAVHGIGLFIAPQPTNETERQLFELMRSYHLDLGGGFSPSMDNLLTALSSCFTLLCGFAGLTNAYLLRRNAQSELFGGVLIINLIFFGVCFAIMACFTFLPPIIMTGAIFVFLALAFVFRKLQPANSN